MLQVANIPVHACTHERRQWKQSKTLKDISWWSAMFSCLLGFIVKHKMATLPHANENIIGQVLPRASFHDVANIMLCHNNPMCFNNARRIESSVTFVWVARQLNWLCLAYIFGTCHSSTLMCLLINTPRPGLYIRPHLEFGQEDITARERWPFSFQPLIPEHILALLGI